MPTKVILWGTGILYNKYINSISFYEMNGDIEILGVTSNDSYYGRIDNHDFVKKQDLRSINFDYIIVTALQSYQIILDEIRNLGIDTQKVLPVDIFDIPNFHFSRYIELLNQKISIISNNCWGESRIIH